MNMLVELLILVIAAVVVFMVANFLMTKGKFEEPLQRIILLIIGLLFLVWLANIVSGGALFGRMVVIR